MGTALQVGPAFLPATCGASLYKVEVWQISLGLKQGAWTPQLESSFQSWAEPQITSRTGLDCRSLSFTVSTWSLAGHVMA